jgi:hypothetical protein
MHLLAGWIKGRDGQAFIWTVLAEFISFLGALLQKAIEGLQERPGGIPLTAADWIAIASIHWQLIAIGLGTLLGSYVLAPKARTNPRALLFPYGAVAVTLVVIPLIYLFWPWIGPDWLRVVVTVVIGAIVLYVCVRAAPRVRT